MSTTRDDDSSDSESRADRLWAWFRTVYGSALNAQFGPSIPDTWVSAIGQMTDEQLRTGCKQLRKVGGRYPPSMFDFLAMCRSADPRTSTPMPELPKTPAEDHRAAVLAEARKRAADAKEEGLSTLEIAKRPIEDQDTPEAHAMRLDIACWQAAERGEHIEPARYAPGWPKGRR